MDTKIILRVLATKYLYKPTELMNPSHTAQVANNIKTFAYQSLYL